MLQRGTIACLAVSLLWAGTARAESPFPDTGVHYRIKAHLEPARGRIQGMLHLRLRNSARVPLREVRLHLYLNAFANEETLFMRKGRGRMRYSRWDPSMPGWIKVLLATRGQTALKHKLLHDGTVVAVTLDEPLLPGEDQSLMLEFESVLPHLYARTGRAGDFLMVAQWYPKLCHLGQDGAWHSPPYHAYEEYFGPFASYRVDLTLPRGWTVGATGTRPRPDQGGEEQGLRRIWLEADGVHDLAFAAWPAFVRQETAVSGVKVSLLTVPGRGASPRILAALAGGLDRLQRWLLPYPYPRLTVVDVPTRALGAGGMEYPTLFTAWTPRWVPAWHRGVDVLILHELTHQYFQGMVASNEVKEPWLDEGVTTYVTGLMADEIYGQAGSMMALGPARLGHHQQRRLLAMRGGRPPLAVAQPAAAFKSAGAYGRTVYARAALMLATVESLVGRERMLAALGAYARRYAFTHPRGEDLERALLRAADSAGARPAVKAVLDGVLRQREDVDYSLTCANGEVKVERRGALALPLELELTTASGRQVRQIQGKLAAQTIKAPGLTGAMLGPERRLGLDPTPNDLACVVDRTAGPRAGAWQWTALLQALLQLVGP